MSSLAAPDSARPAGFEATATDRVNDFPQRVLRWALVANVIISMSLFNETLVPPSLASIQQYATILLWLVIAGCAISMKPILRWETGTDLLALLAFYGFAICSVLWSDLSAASLMKAAALTVTCVCAGLLATRMTVEDIVANVNIGLLVICLASLVAVAFFPAIGITQEWSHEGNWQGVFESKQSLGIIGAIFMFFSAYQWLIRRNHLWFAITFLSATACAIGSESRGGGALALVACLCVYLAGRSSRSAMWLSFAPFGLALFASILIAWLFSTGNDSFEVFGSKIDLTQRTYIWQHALAHYGERPILGYGINGFWTIKEIYNEFLRNHGWILDNFHSGYVAILTETGVVGFMLFLTTTLLFGVRMVTSIREQTMPRSRIVALIGFLVLIYMIDLTETIFLRSTSFISTLVFMFLINAALPYQGRAQR
ncbi:MAG: ligase [Tardiphaga sp.]|jgi:exopolysaccharide production protein ExoQ|nr:ligase [Tardiphaga sp.]